MKSHTPLWVGLIATLFLLQLGWWGATILRLSDNLVESRFRSLDVERALTELELKDRGWDELKKEHPDFVLSPSSKAPKPTLSANTLAKLQDVRQSYRNMVFAEAGLFLLLTILTLAFFWKTWRHEQFLVLQHQNFLHAVTHEFRSPLQSLRLALETLARRPDPERAKTYSAGMVEDLDRLEGMVENLLAVGRLEATAFDAQPRVVDLSQETERLCAHWQEHTENASSTVHLAIEPSVSALADPTTLEPIVRNLLDNARKYGEGSDIQLSVFSENACALLRVQDSGRGLTSEEQPNVFKRFWRAGDERIRTAQGSGLGLFLVKELIDAQGAQISVESGGLNQGCSFTISWPAVAEATSTTAS